MTRSKSITVVLLAVCVAALSVAPAAGAPAKAAGKPPAHLGKQHAAELVVAYDGVRAASAVEDEVRAAGGALAKRSSHSSQRSRDLVRAKDAGSARRLRERLERLPGVRYVEPVIEYTAQRVPTDPEYGDQWGLPRIGAPAAWDLTTGSSDVVVAIADTGVDLQHPDFAGRLDTVNGRDFVNDDWDPDDDEGHGTHVAGIAAAAMDNGVEGCGVASSVRILPIKVLDKSGSGINYDVAAGIEWAADRGADVINLSVGSRYYSQAIAEAVAYAQGKDVLVVAAAGNDYGATVSYPARLPGVVSVSAVTASDALATFSNKGPEIDLGAPGVGIYSVLPDAPGEAWNGTSMAAPFVAGTAALVLSAWPELTADEVAQVLYATAEDIGAAGKDDEFGYGMLRADAAIAGLPSGADAHEPDDSAAEAGAAVVGETYAHTAFPAGDEDWHSFAAVEGHVYSIRASALLGGADTVLTLYGTDGSTEVTSSDDVAEGDLSSRIDWIAPASGTYYFANADVTNSGGSYRVHVADTTPLFGADAYEDDDTTATAKPLSLGVPTTHTVSPVGDSDYMYIDAEAGRTYRFFTDGLSESADTYLFLYDAAEAQLAEHDDADYYGGDLSSEILWTAASAGRLYIENWDGWMSGGSYRLAVEDITPPLDSHEPDDTFGQARTLELGVPTTHTAQPPGESDFSVFEAQAGHTYRARADHLVDGADTYLKVFGSSTTSLLGSSDDVDYDNGDRSSLVEWTSPYTGPVYVVNEDAWEAGGGYTLKVSDLSVPPVEVEGFSGADRYATAAMVSAATFPTGSPTVLVATGDNYPDALAAGSLAGAWDAPLLLVPPSGSLPSAVADEIGRLGATRVIVLGGTGAVGEAMASQVRAELALPATLMRYGGATRYDTARLVGGATRTKLLADGRPWPGKAFVVTGSGFADALVASPLSFATGEPIVLMPPTLDAATASFISAMGLHELTILGGTGAVSAATSAALDGVAGVASVHRISDVDRYATAVSVAEYASGRGFTWDGVAVATGERYPDALAGGCMQGRDRSVMLLTPVASLAPAAEAALSANKDEIAGVRFLGGTGAVSEATREQVYEALR